MLTTSLQKCSVSFLVVVFLMQSMQTYQVELGSNPRQSTYCLRAKDLTSLSLHFLICKVEVMKLISLWGSNEIANTSALSSVQLIVSTISVLLFFFKLIN